MIYLLAYLLIAVCASIWTWVSWKGEKHRLTVILALGLMWPLVWSLLIIQSIRGRYPPANCAWCGRTVAPLNGSLDVWEKHYLTECEKHPLAIKAKRLENWLEEMDTSKTSLRLTTERLLAAIHYFADARDVEDMRKLARTILEKEAHS